MSRSHKTTQVRVPCRTAGKERQRTIFYPRLRARHSLYPLDIATFHKAYDAIDTVNVSQDETRQIQRCRPTDCVSGKELHAKKENRLRVCNWTDMVISID